MIFMLTIWIPPNKAKEGWELAMKGIAKAKGLPKFITKWKIFGTTGGLDGYKMYELIYTEKGKSDEAFVEIQKAMRPMDEVEGIRFKIEPLMGMKDMASTI